MLKIYNLQGIKIWDWGFCYDIEIKDLSFTCERIYYDLKGFHVLESPYVYDPIRQEKIEKKLKKKKFFLKNPRYRTGKDPLYGLSLTGP